MQPQSSGGTIGTQQDKASTARDVSAKFDAPFVYQIVLGSNDNHYVTINVHTITKSI